MTEEHDDSQEGQEAQEEQEEVTEQSTALAETTPSDLMATLADRGMIVPVAPPDQIRAAFDYKQKVLAAILDPSDYLYTVSFKEHGKTRQQVFDNRADADKVAETCGTIARAKPKKSGIVKLASAFGIRAERRTIAGLPGDASASYSYVEYEATHPPTGQTALGIGWCDKSEKGGYISTHDVIATADTRAFNRAVLRLCGFGDVSADEIVAGLPSGSDDESPGIVVDVQTQRQPNALPEPDADEVMIAARTWATHIANRTEQRFMPESKQASFAARQMRAAARRGDAAAAKSLAVAGYRWAGPAQDASHVTPFQVGESPVNYQDFINQKQAAEEQKKKAADGDREEGWDLSGKGSDADDSAPAPQPTGDAASDVPAPDPSAESITIAQGKKISKKLIEALGTKEAAREWLQNSAHVSRAMELRENQVDHVIKALDALANKEG